MLKTLKDLIRDLVHPIAIPLGYLAAIWLFITAMVSRAHFGMYVLVAMLPLPTIYYQFHPYPLGKDFIDLLYFSVLVGIVVHKNGFDRSHSGTLLVMFCATNYLALWHATLNFNLPLPVSTENQLLRDWKNYAEMICFYFLAHNAVKEEDHQKTLVTVIAGVIFFICLREFRGFSQGGAFSYGKRVEGPFWVVGLGANHMGAFVAHYCSVLFGLALLDKHKIRRRFYIAALLVSLHPLFFSYSRGAWVGALAALAFFGLVQKRVILVWLVVLAISWQVVLPTTVVDRITMTEEADGQLEGSAAKRVELWNHAVGVFRENPAFGVGFGAFGLTIPQGAFEGLTDTHNFYLRMLSEQGVVGIAFFIVVLLSAMRCGWRLFRRGRSDFHRGLGLGFMGCVVAETITNMFGDRWSYLMLGGYFFVFWGLVDRSALLSAAPQSQGIGAGPAVTPLATHAGLPVSAPAPHTATRA